MFGFVLVMTAAFFGSPAIATDLESGVAQAMLARPLPRASYLLGRWLGLAIVIVGYSVASGLLAIGAVGLVSGYLPPDPILPVAYLAGQALVLLSLTVLLSTRLPPIAGGAIAVVAYGLAWMAGRPGQDRRWRSARPRWSRVERRDRATSCPPTRSGRASSTGSSPRSSINAGRGEFLAEGSPFFAAAPPSAALVAWSVIWVVLVLDLAVVAAAPARAVAGAVADEGPPGSRRERERGEHGAVRRGAAAARASTPAPSTCRSARPRTPSRSGARPCRTVPGTVAGGHSYGGRVASLAAAAGAGYAGLVLFSYPLHPPGQPDRTEARIAHFPAIDCPVLLLSGESDPFARIELLRAAVAEAPARELVTYPRLGHTLKPVLEDVLDRVRAFVEELEAREYGP